MILVFIFKLSLFISPSPAKQFSNKNCENVPEFEERPSLDNERISRKSIVQVTPHNVLHLETARLQ